MVNVPMPEPVAFLVDWPDEPDLGHYFAEEQAPTGRSQPLITTTQAEAYADARVMEELEAALREMVELAADTRANKELVAHESWIANCAANRIRALIK